MADGFLNFDTALDTKGISQGLASLGGIAAKGAAAVGAALAGMAVAVVKMGSDYEASLSGIKAVSGATDAEMERLTAAAIKAGEDTAYSASESANAIEELIKAGLSVEQVLGGGLTGALDLAAAGELGLADAAEIASTVLNSFRDDALTMTQAANLLAGAANASATDVGELKYGLSMVSAVASGVGMTFKDTATSLAVFAQNGLKGSDAGTSLKTMLSRLTPMTDKAADAMDDLGLLTDEGTSAFYDASGSMKSLSEIADLLQTSMAHLSDEQRQQAMYTLFGSDAIRGANILFKEGAAGVEAMADAMSKVTAAEVAAERLNNLKGAVEFLSGSLETLGIKIYQSFQNPLKEAVQAANVAVDELSRAFDAPEMQGALETIGNAFTGFVRALGDFVTTWIPRVVQGIAGLIEHWDKFAFVLTTGLAILGAWKAGLAVSAVIKAWQTAMTAASAATAIYTATLASSGTAAAVSAAKISAFQLIVGVLSGKIGLVTAAQWLWNIAMNANPIGLLVAGITACVAIAWGLAKAFNGVSNEQERLNEQTERTVDKMEALRKESQDSIGAYEERKEALEAQRIEMDDLVGSILALNAAESKTAEQEQQLIAYAANLNKQIPDLGLAYDKTTGHINMSAEALQAYADAQSATLSRDASYERINELTKERATLEVSLNNAQAERAAAVERLATAQGKDWDATKANVELLDESIATQQRNISVLKQAEDIEAAAAAKSAAIVEKYEGQKVAALQQSTDQIQELSEEQAKALSDSVNKYADITANVFDRIEKQKRVSVKDMMKTLQQNTKIVAQWEEDLATLTARGLDEGLIAQLRAAGPEAAKSVRGLVKASDKELRGLNTAYAGAARQATASGVAALSTDAIPDAGAKAVIQASASMSEAVTESNFSATGKQISKNVAIGVDSEAVAKAATGEVAQASAATSKAVGNANFDAAGREISGNVTSGVKSKSDTVVSATEQAVQQARSQAAKEVVDAGFDGIGKLMAYGVSRGLRSGKSSVISAMQELCREALAATRQALDIHSPSRKTTWIGQMFAAGMPVGMRSKLAEIRASARTLADAAYGAVMGRQAQFAAAYASGGSSIVNAKNAERIAQGGAGADLDALVAKLVSAGAFQGKVVLENGVEVGRWVAPTVAKVNGSAATAMKRSGYRVKK